jgi:hypothetical protein
MIVDRALIRRAAFRFVLVYLVLYLLPVVSMLVPFTGALGVGLQALMKVVVPPFARHVLRIDTPVVWHESGSGDTLFDWVSIPLCALVASLAAIGWSLAADRRGDHPRLPDALRIYVRYGLAATMLGYGMSKVFPTQFPPVDPGRLMEPYGWFSPMGVVWAFMGTSVAYQILSGVGEAAGAVLLLFRRTTTPGALLLLAVLGNVVLLNLCYDVPVKQFSMHLWAMALFLASPDLKLLFEALVLRRAVRPAAVDWRPADRRWRIALLAGKGLLVAFLLFGQVMGAWRGYKQYGYGRTAEPFEGVWTVEDLSPNAPGWRRVGLGPWRASVATAQDPYVVYGLQFDRPARIVLRGAGGETLSFTIQVAGDALTLDGPFRATLRRVPLAQIPLRARPFRWVQEFPYNR